MKLKNQICTLKQAKELKELGLNLASYFHWIATTGMTPYIYHLNGTTWIQQIENDPSYPAYSCAELGVLLPYQIIHDSVAYIFTLWKVHQQFSCAYENCKENKIHLFDEIIDGEHEAHAKADLLIHLLKEKIIKSEDLNL